MITQFDEITFETAKDIYKSIGFDLPNGWDKTDNETIKLILKLGASKLIIKEEDTYEPNEFSIDEIYLGKNNIHIPYVISRNAAKRAAVIWIVTSTISVLSFNGFEAYALSCAVNLLNTYISIFETLNDKQKCIFFRIYYLYENSDKQQGVSEEMIESFIVNEDGALFCPVSDQIKCKIRNPENGQLCGGNINTSSIIEELLDKEVIKKVNGNFIPYAFFV